MKLFWGLRTCQSASVYVHEEIAVDDFFCSDDESFFVPLVARTVLPVHVADVAEFGAASAGHVIRS